MVIPLACKLGGFVGAIATKQYATASGWTP